MAEYKRMEAAEMKRCRRKYYSDQLYVVLSPVLKHYSDSCRELSPVEVWTEALRLAEELAMSPRPDREIKDMAEELAEDYLLWSDTPEQRRTDEEAERTAFLVLMTLLFMLHAPMIGKAGHGCTEIIDNLARVVASHPLCNDFIRRSHVTEEEEEKQDRYVEAFDYLLSDVADDREEDEDVKVEAIQNFVDTAIRHGDETTVKEMKCALSDFNAEQGNIYETPLRDLSNWLMKRNNEKRGDNYYDVDVVDCQIGKMAVSRLPQKEII